MNSPEARTFGNSFQLNNCAQLKIQADSSTWRHLGAKMRKPQRLPGLYFQLDSQQYPDLNFENNVRINIYS